MATTDHAYRFRTSCTCSLPVRHSQSPLAQTCHHYDTATRKIVPVSCLSIRHQPMDSLAGSVPPDSSSRYAMKARRRANRSDSYRSWNSGSALRALKVWLVGKFSSRVTSAPSGKPSASAMLLICASSPRLDKNSNSEIRRYCRKRVSKPSSARGSSDGSRVDRRDTSR